MNAKLSGKSKFRNQLGQGMTEYLIVVALIAVAAIGVYGFFGQTLRSQTDLAPGKRTPYWVLIR